MLSFNKYYFEINLTSHLVFLCLVHISYFPLWRIHVSQASRSLTVIPMKPIIGLYGPMFLPSPQYTVGKRNYFMGYGILLHELPVVAILFIQSNNKEEFCTSRDIL